MKKESQGFVRLVAKARATNTGRSYADRKSGFAAPEDVNQTALLATVASALEAGMKLKDWDFVAEGYAMLVDYFHISTPAT